MKIRWMLYFNFVVTPRNFIIALIKLGGVTTKLKYNIFHHANFQGTKVDVIVCVSSCGNNLVLFSWEQVIII